MPDRRPLVLINGSLYVLPVGDDLVTHRPLVLDGGELKQLDAVENPRDHAVFVYIDETQQVQQWNGFDILIGVVNPTDFNVHDIQTNVIAGPAPNQLAVAELNSHPIFGGPYSTVAFQDVTAYPIFGTGPGTIAARVVEGLVILES